MIFGLEGVVQSNYERVIARCQDLLLRQRSLDLVSFDHLLLTEYWRPISILADQRVLGSLPFIAYNLLDLFSRTK